MFRQDFKRKIETRNFRRQSRHYSYAYIYEITIKIMIWTYVELNFKIKLAKRQPGQIQNVMVTLYPPSACRWLIVGRLQLLMLASWGTRPLPRRAISWIQKVVSDVSSRVKSQAAAAQLVCHRQSQSRKWVHSPTDGCSFLRWRRCEGDAVVLFDG